jgi:hypothetical protein
VVPLNAKGTARQRYELSKQLQELHIDIALPSETRFKVHERFFILNYHIYETDRFPDRKGGTVVASPQPCILASLVSVEAQGSAYRLVIEKYCLQLFINLQVMPALMGKSFIFRYKSILNTKHQYWYRECRILQETNFRLEISVPQ